MTQDERIKAAIEEMQADREREAEKKTRDCLNRIVVQQEVIRQATIVIAKAKEELKAITVDTIDISIAS